MERLYLIRVDMERFLGPYSLKQVKEAFQRMEFGLQDEISGSLRQWVAFDDFENIKKHYPELVQLVQKEMLSGWGLGGQAGVDASGLPVRTSQPAKSTSGFLLGTLIFVLLVLGVVVSFPYIKDGDLSQVLSFLKDRQLHTAKTLYGERYNAKFEAFMDRNRETINQAMKKKKQAAQWLPYVRAVAFEKDGRWDGLSAKRLRGQAEAFLPTDCSMAYWEQRWAQTKDQWPKLLDASLFVKEDWAVLLMLDPHWVMNRSPGTSWLHPGNYAEACLKIALKSLQRVAGDKPSGEAKVLLSRIKWQLGVINAQAPDEDFEMSGTLWTLSCLEDARELSSLKNCLNSVSPKGSWKDFIELTMTIRKLTLTLQGKKSLDETELGNFETDLSDLVSRQADLPFGWEAEIKYFQEVVQLDGNAEQAKANVLLKYPQNNLNH